jgi:hypothetical protein|tara:strand:- start:1042 stop:1194 length:153 start_codon:yes stop_codon:yes gene_type:complete
MRFICFFLLFFGCSDFLEVQSSGDLADVPYDEVEVAGFECDSAEICDTSG